MSKLEFTTEPFMRNIIATSLNISLRFRRICLMFNTSSFPAYIFMFCPSSVNSCKNSSGDTKSVDPNKICMHPWTHWKHHITILCKNVEDPTISVSESILVYLYWGYTPPRLLWGIPGFAFCSQVLAEQLPQQMKLHRRQKRLPDGQVSFERSQPSNWRSFHKLTE